MKYNPLFWAEPNDPSDPGDDPQWNTGGGAKKKKPRISPAGSKAAQKKKPGGRVFLRRFLDLPYFEKWGSPKMRRKKKPGCPGSFFAPWDTLGFFFAPHPVSIWFFSLFVELTTAFWACFLSFCLYTGTVKEEYTDHLAQINQQGENDT